MQIISNGDNLHEMTNPDCWKKQDKYFKMSSAANFTQSAESQIFSLGDWLTHKKAKCSW